MTETPVPAEYAPHMVMASRYSPLLYAIRDIDPDICVLVHHKQATPILTVSLEEAARRASNVWHARDAIKMWQAIVLEICALKVREARDVAEPVNCKQIAQSIRNAKGTYLGGYDDSRLDAFHHGMDTAANIVEGIFDGTLQSQVNLAEPRALPDRETLARTIFGIMTFGGTWFSSDGILEMRSLCAADRALELCAGAASDGESLAEARRTISRLTLERDALASSLRNTLAREEKAEAERDAATKRAQEAEADYKRLQGTNESLRIELNELGDKEILLSAERDGLRSQLAKAQPAAAVPAKPTLKELKASEWEALLAVNRAVQHMNATAPEDEVAFARARAMLIYRQAEYGRAAAAVDAAREVKN